LLREVRVLAGWEVDFDDVSVLAALRRRAVGASGSGGFSPLVEVWGCEDFSGLVEASRLGEDFVALVEADVFLSVVPVFEGRLESLADFVATGPEAGAELSAVVGSCFLDVATGAGSISNAC